MTDYRNKNVPPDLDSELRTTAKMVEQVAGRIQPNAAFTSRLEQRIGESFQAAEVRPMLNIRKIAPAVLAVLATAVLIVVVEWMIRSIAPQPVPGAGRTPLPNATESIQATVTMQPTPALPIQTYDWRGASLSVAAAMPESPSEVDIYSAQAAPHASVEEARALAERFGIHGSAYETPGELPGTADFLLTDGKQSLRVRSSGYLEYIADMVKAYNSMAAVQNPDAEQIIAAFLSARGYTFPYRIQWSQFRSAYLVEPLTADGAILRYEPYSQPMMLVNLSEDGGVLRLQTSLLDISSDPVARVGIISAQDALQRLLDPNRTNGVLESGHSSAPAMRQWMRTYPLDQVLTIYGYVRSVRPVDAGQPAFIQLDGFPATGATSGLEQFKDPTYIAATGHLASENGALWLRVDSWSVSELPEEGLAGTLQRENGQAVLTTNEGEQITLPDVPADVPMPFQNAYVVGTRTGGLLDWKSIDDRALGGGGGGGGGGSGFFKLNLSGTPVPFPTALPAPADTSAGSSAVPQPVEGLRGILSITINKQPDGSQVASYGFLPLTAGTSGGYMRLEGEGLEPLQAYNSRPVDIWGTMQAQPDGSIGKLQVERFNIPFPDLRVQVLQGKQKLVPLEGQPATLLTTSDGETYVQLMQDGTTDASLIGVEGDEVQLECVAIPGDTYAGYPALRVLGGTLAIDPKSGLHMTLPITMDQPITLESPPMDAPRGPVSASIDSIELERFVSDPRYAVQRGGAQPLYLQPVWRFSGHYSSGDEFEILIQATREEFLLPELEPSVQPG